MSLGLKGEYNHSIDAKGRLIVPSKLREHLGLTFVITKGMDNNLYAYPNKEWELFDEKLNQLPVMTNKAARDYVRFFEGSACDCEVDNQGRINIPKNLRDYAGITKDVTIVGMGTKAEIWSKEAWDAKNAPDIMDINDLAAEVGNLGFVL